MSLLNLFSDWFQALVSKQLTRGGVLQNTWSTFSFLWWSRRHAIIQSSQWRRQSTMYQVWQITCFVWESQKGQKTPVKVMLEGPLHWMTMGNSGLLGLSAGGLTVENRDHMESIPELPTTWTGSRKLCRKTEFTIFYYSVYKSLCAEQNLNKYTK